MTDWADPSNWVPSGANGADSVGDDVAFHDLPSEAFPLRIICLAPDDRTVVFHAVVEDVPTVLPIPGFGPGSVDRVIVLYGDGTWEETTSE